MDMKAHFVDRGRGWWLLRPRIRAWAQGSVPGLGPPGASRIATLHIDFHFWTALGWECSTGRGSFEGVLDSHCVLAGYLSSWVDKVLCSVQKSYVQFQSLMFSSKVWCSVPKSCVQFQSLVLSSKVLCSVPKSYVQFKSLMVSSKSLMFSSKVLCPGSKVY